MKVYLTMKFMFLMTSCILRCKLEQSDCFLEKVLIETKALGHCNLKEMKKKITEGKMELRKNRLSG